MLAQPKKYVIVLNNSVTGEKTILSVPASYISASVNFNLYSIAIKEFKEA